MGPRGGIGRRDGFKIHFLQGSVSSSLTVGTMRRFFTPHQLFNRSGSVVSHILGLATAVQASPILQSWTHIRYRFARSIETG